MVGLVKNALKKTLGLQASPSMNCRKTCATLNSASTTDLIYQTNELDSEMLTQNHLVHCRRMKPLQEEEVFSDEEQIPAKKRVRYFQCCRKKYWKRWSKEYLTCLREHHKINPGGDNLIAERDIVLIKEENLPRNKWKLGKVLNIITGKDGIERGVTLKTTTRGRTYEID